MYPAFVTKKPPISRKILAAVLSVVALTAAILIVAHPERYIQSAKNGLLLFAVGVLPALFPFFFLTRVLTGLGTVRSLTDACGGAARRAFKLQPSAAYIFFMSALSGYPVGAKLMSELYGGASARDMTRAAAVCSTTGPIFAAGTVGSALLGSTTAGLVIFLSHLTAVLIFALVSGIGCKQPDTPDARHAPPAPAKGADNLLADSVYGSVTAILGVGGFVCLCYVLIDMLAASRLLSAAAGIFANGLNAFSIDPALGKGLLSGLIEMTRGCADIAASSASLAAKTVGCCFTVTLSGACIAAQSLAFLGKKGVKPGLFLFYKLLTALTAAAVCFVLTRFIPL